MSTRKKKPTPKKSVRRTKKKEAKIDPMSIYGISVSNKRLKELHRDIEKLLDPMPNAADRYFGRTDFPEGRDQMYPETPPTAYWKVGV